MEDIKQVLALFKSAEEWNSYIEISNLKDELVNQLTTVPLKWTNRSLK